MKKALFVFAVVALIASCKKDKSIPYDNDTPPPQNTNFTPMTIGSYWVYEYSSTDTNNITTINGTDTVRVVQDSIINGNTYRMFKGNLSYACSTCYFFRRDSSGYLVNQNGRIMFSATNFTDTLYIDTTQPLLYTANYKMIADTSITVPAGTFSTYDYRGHVYITNPNPIPNPRITGNFYANSIGIVKSRYVFVGGTDYLEAKLLSYYIAP